MTIGNKDTMLGLYPYKDITHREREIMTLLARGFSYEEIGKELIISKNTVKYHVSSLLQKTGFKNATNLIANAVSQGVIHL